ncbi:MAG: hypothetical protein WD154_06690 [Nitrosopumilaceae archaeon]
MAKKKKFFYKKTKQTTPEREESTKSSINNVEKNITKQRLTTEKYSKILTGIKYVYITVFFALLAGFFSPLITGHSFDLVIIGVIVLFVGLGGAILVYKAATSEKRRTIYLGSGFALIIISLIFIYDIIGKPLITF